MLNRFSREGLRSGIPDEIVIAYLAILRLIPSPLHVTDVVGFFLMIDEEFRNTLADVLRGIPEGDCDLH